MSLASGRANRHTWRGPSYSETPQEPTGIGRGSKRGGRFVGTYSNAAGGFFGCSVWEGHEDDEGQGLPVSAMVNNVITDDIGKEMYILGSNPGSDEDATPAPGSAYSSTVKMSRATLSKASTRSTPRHTGGRNNTSPVEQGPSRVNE